AQCRRTSRYSRQPAPGGVHDQLQDPGALQRLRRGLCESRRAGKSGGRRWPLRAAERTWTRRSARPRCDRTASAPTGRHQSVCRQLASPAGRTRRDGSRLTALSGVVPIAPTPFDQSEAVDYVGQKRVIDFLIDAGVDGICILANYSEQFALTNAERARLTGVTLRNV